MELEALLWLHRKMCDGHPAPDPSCLYAALLLGRVVACPSLCVANDDLRRTCRSEVIRRLKFGGLSDAAWLMLERGLKEGSDWWNAVEIELFANISNLGNFQSRQPRTILTVSAFEFGNEIAFSPALAFPLEPANVVSLLLPADKFESDAVQLAFFPPPLQQDVILSAAFLRDVAEFVGADWIFPGDSAGVLIIAKLAYGVFLGDISVSSRFGAALNQSVPFPPSYPPTYLSKWEYSARSSPGTYRAPPMVLVSDNDGTQYVSLDQARLQENLQLLGGVAFLKREYSFAGKGVAPLLLNSGPIPPMRVMERSFGIDRMDMSLPCRIFMQKAVYSDQEPIGVRFFAQSGRLWAAHASKLIGYSTNFGTAYETIRDQGIEDAVVNLVQALEFTGFGAAWFWIETGTNKPFLIDFNPRLERGACINAVYSGLGDPCTTFQRYISEGIVPGAPLFAPAGIKFVFPLRISVLELEDPSQKQYLLKLGAWNLHVEADKRLSREVKKRMEKCSSCA